MVQIPQATIREFLRIAAVALALGSSALPAARAEQDKGTRAGLGGSTKMRLGLASTAQSEGESELTSSDELGRNRFAAQESDQSGVTPQEVADRANANGTILLKVRPL